MLAQAPVLRVLRSPTTTPIDKEYAYELASIASIDLHAHATAMLDAKADVGHLSAAQLLLMDSKRYTIGGKQLRISVLETTRAQQALVQRAALQAAMGEATRDEGVDALLFFVVDIVREEAVFISGADEAARIVEKAWGAKVDSLGQLVLPGVLSRKKQIVPVLEKAAAAETHMEDEL